MYKNETNVKLWHLWNKVHFVSQDYGATTILIFEKKHTPWSERTEVLINVAHNKYSIHL